MPRFTYVSRDSQGQRVTAVAEAESRQNLLGQLKDRGLTVVEVTELGGPSQETPAGRNGTSRRAVSLGRVDASELAVFWREFATMVAAGLPVIEALESIAQELEHAKLRGVLSGVIGNMWEGFNLSQSLKKYPRIFSPMVVALIGSAEESGSLAEVADQLATYLENRDRLVRKVRAALTYPIFLCVFFLVVVTVAAVWIIPRFRDIYEGFHAKLPWLTEAVFAVNAFILARFPWMVAVSAALILAGILWARTASGRTAIDRASLRLPIFGTLLQRADVVDADGIGLRLRFDSMLLINIGRLRDDHRILTDIFDPQLVDDEQVGMQQPVNLLFDDLRLRIVAPVREEQAREPFCDRELAQMLRTGKKVRMRDVALREVVTEGGELRTVAEDVRS